MWGWSEGGALQCLPTWVSLQRERDRVPSEGNRTLNALKLQSSSNETSARRKRHPLSCGRWEPPFLGASGGQVWSSLPLSTEHSCKDVACVHGALCWSVFSGLFLNISYHQHLLSLAGHWGPRGGRRGAWGGNRCKSLWWPMEGESVSGAREATGKSMKVFLDLQATVLALSSLPTPRFLTPGCSVLSPFVFSSLFLSIQHSFIAPRKWDNRW